LIKAKGEEHCPHVFLAYLVKGFREIQFEENTWSFGLLQRVDHFMREDDTIHDLSAFNIA
jgi:hypothetical protein